MQAAAYGEVFGACIQGAGMSLWLRNGEEIGKCTLGQLGSGALSWTWGSPQHRKPNLEQRADKKPDCAVVVDTHLRMGSVMHVSRLCFFSK